MNIIQWIWSLWTLLHDLIRSLGWDSWDRPIAPIPILNMDPDPIGPIPASDAPVQTLIPDPVQPPVPDPIPDPIPDQTTRQPIKVYAGLRGVNDLIKEEAQVILKEFHENIKEDVWEIEDANKHYGVHHRPTVTGIGAFNGEKKVPRGTILFVYISTLVTQEQHAKDKDASYVYSYGRFMGHDCLIDARFNKTPEPYDGSRLNHKCVKPNCRVRWMKDKETGLWYLLFYTLRVVKVGEQFTIDYNYCGRRDLDMTKAYLTHHSRIPKRFFMPCLCNHPGDCPKEMGFNKKEIFGCK